MHVCVYAELARLNVSVLDERSGVVSAVYGLFFFRGVLEKCPNKLLNKSSRSLGFNHLILNTD